MTETVHYKNVSLKKEDYLSLDRIRKIITPHIVQSRSGTIGLLINKEIARLNGKARPRDKQK